MFFSVGVPKPALHDGSNHETHAHTLNNIIIHDIACKDCGNGQLIQTNTCTAF